MAGAGQPGLAVGLQNPGIISIPVGFIGCWLGTMLAREPSAEAMFDELYVRSETGLGSEKGRPAPWRRPRTAAATAVLPK